MGLRDVKARRQAERENGNKPRTLAELRAAKKNATQARFGGLAALRERKVQQRKVSSKHDFIIDGIRYHNARIIDLAPRVWGTIDVSNGDKTYRFNNQYGSWLHDLGDNRLAEPAAVARAMGTSLTQYDLANTLQNRWYAELKDQGVPTPEERIRQREEEGKQQRRQGRKKKES